MSKVKEALIADLSQKTGMDCRAVVEELFKRGTLDDCLARQHVAKAEFFRRLCNSDKLVSQIQEDIAGELGYTRERVHQLVTNWSDRRRAPGV